MIWYSAKVGKSNCIIHKSVNWQINESANQKIVKFPSTNNLVLCQGENDVLNEIKVCLRRDRFTKFINYSDF